jgi:hypothetical protein
MILRLCLQQQQHRQHVLWLWPHSSAQERSRRSCDLPQLLIAQENTEQAGLPAPEGAHGLLADRDRQCLQVEAVVNYTPSVRIQTAPSKTFNMSDEWMRVKVCLSERYGADGASVAFTLISETQTWYRMTRKRIEQSRVVDHAKPYEQQQ